MVYGSKLLVIPIGCAVASWFLPPSTLAVLSSVVTMETGDETTNQGVEIPGEAVAPVAGKLSLKVLEIAKDCQNQNGLRHGDYHQYRQYCTRRLKRVRSSRDIRFMFGKGKSFVQKVSPSTEAPLLERRGLVFCFSVGTIHEADTNDDGSSFRPIIPAGINDALRHRARHTAAPAVVPAPLPPAERNGPSRDASASIAPTRRGERPGVDAEEALLLSRPGRRPDTQSGGRCTPSSSMLYAPYMYTWR